MFNWPMRLRDSKPSNVRGFYISETGNTVGVMGPNHPLWILWSRDR